MDVTFKRRLGKLDVVKEASIWDIAAISWPMLMTATMNFVIAQTGVMILGIYRSDAEVGYYAVAVKLATLTTFVLQTINSIAAPRFSALFHAGKMDELFYVARQSSKLIFWTTAPCPYLSACLWQARAERFFWTRLCCRLYGIGFF
jgi:O-antigen/teichoic acid export membrane protein